MSNLSDCFSRLPHLNAALNATACGLLVIGYLFIRRKRVTAHRNCMMAAFATSCLFLVSYVTHYVWRASVKGGTHTRLGAEGLVKLGYGLMLISHIVLAMAVPVLAIVMIRLGLTGRIDAHRRLARFAYPIWLYVSATGVLIYFMLYHWYRAG